MDSTGLLRQSVGEGERVNLVLTVSTQPGPVRGGGARRVSDGSVVSLRKTEREKPSGFPLGFALRDEQSAITQGRRAVLTTAI